jgi:hypothetical protein
MSLVSRVNEELTYDFLFKDNSLDDRDRNVEADLYKIDIFGNPYMISMGEKHLHPMDKKEELYYMIVYLIVYNKVVCKIGVYEMMHDDSITHRNAPYESMELILQPKFYTSPQELEPFMYDETKDKETNSEEQENGEEQENEEKESDITEIVKGQFLDTIPTKTHLEMGVYYKMFSQLVKHMKENDLGETKVQSSGFDGILSYNKKGSLFKKDGVDSNKKTLLHMNLEYFDDVTITSELLMVYEYLCNTKVILVDNKGDLVSFSLIENIDKEKTKTNLRSSTKILGLKCYKKYDPEKVLFVSKSGNKKLVANDPPMPFGTLSKEKMQKIKELYESEEHEFVLPKTQFKTMKTYFEK